MRGSPLLAVFGGLALLMTPLASLAEPEAEAPVMVVDLHVDLPWQVHFKGRVPDMTEGHVTAAGLAAGRYGGLVLPIYLPDYLHADGAHVEDADAVLATIEQLLAKNPLFLPLRSAFAEPERISTWLAIEGAGAFAQDPTQLDRFIALGVRLVGPAHGKNGPLASAATGEKADYGLTPVGKEICHRIYRLGALVDVSHLSDAAFDDLVPIAEAHGAPIVATHSNARALARHPRNLSDAQLRAIGKSGGVAGVNFHSAFVADSSEVTLTHVLAQIDYMIGMAGIDHVAIGSDFDGGIRPAKGLADASHMPALATALKKRGVSHADVLKIFSLNALRVLAWRPQPAASAPADPSPSERATGG